MASSSPSHGPSRWRGSGRSFEGDWQYTISDLQVPRDGQGKSSMGDNHRVIAALWDLGQGGLVVLFNWLRLRVWGTRKSCDMRMLRINVKKRIRKLAEEAASSTSTFLEPSLFFQMQNTETPFSSEKPVASWNSRRFPPAAALKNPASLEQWQRIWRRQR